ncbi:MAG TPA: tRNA-uridine aminocarboxypropyltransferase [Treponemataceae bacterium]|nr:tRNA-uridine aminocarboxypropyltransferase [Treponemataceae bacterium]
MSERCHRCRRPVAACYCREIKPINPGVKFIFLMHPKEAYHQRTGTGRLASLSLTGSEIIVGIDFSENARVNELIGGRGEGAGLYPVLLYPGEDARYTDDPDFREAIAERTLLVFVVDATWFFARKMITLSANLRALPKLSFRNGYRSQFGFKRQPAPECLSTIESAHYLIDELRKAGIARPEADPAPLMDVFLRMVDYQLARERDRNMAEALEQYPDLFK